MNKITTIDAILSNIILDKLYDIIFHTNCSVDVRLYVDSCYDMVFDLARLDDARITLINSYPNI